MAPCDGERPQAACRNRACGRLAQRYLCGFGKTGVIAAGESETITVHVDRRDIASYDAYGHGTYIIEAGDYYFTAATDSHNAVNNILAAKNYTVADGMDAEGNAELTYMFHMKHSL